MDDIQAKLRQELKPYFSREQGSVPTLSELEKLPLLSACLKEGLRLVVPSLAFLLAKADEFRDFQRFYANQWDRLSVGSLIGVPRVFPDTDLHFKEYTIPRGVSIIIPYAVTVIHSLPISSNNNSDSNIRLLYLCPLTGCTWIRTCSRTQRDSNHRAGWTPSMNQRE